MSDMSDRYLSKLELAAEAYSSEPDLAGLLAVFLGEACAEIRNLRGGLSSDELQSRKREAT